VLLEETGLTPASITQCGAMGHDWGEVHTVTVFHKVMVGSADVQMNSEHEDYRWISKIEDGIHPYLLHMIKGSGIFPTLGNRL
jgi:8-oxo-dGTP pyrophosphatase MutT (NUDIX family)